MSGSDFVPSFSTALMCRAPPSLF